MGEFVTIEKPVETPILQVREIEKEEISLIRFGIIETSLTAINQCKDVGHQQYEYTVKLLCSNKLDHNGYLIDNKLINKAIKESIEQMDSCERLCIHFADTIQKVAADHSVDLCELNVYLKPIVPNPSKPDYAAFELVRKYKPRL